VSKGVLDSIVQGLASQQAVAMARIWLLSPRDLCDACYAPNVEIVLNASIWLPGPVRL
jgi:hypothetical protein